jgi:hypothetical protein
MKVDFLRTAKDELDESFLFYEHELEGLGYRFVNEIYSTVERIKFYPLAWQKIYKNVRRCLVKTFPYAVIYQIVEEENKILIVALAHLHRKPMYWKDRLKKF